MSSEWHDRLVWLGARDVQTEGQWNWECQGELIPVNPKSFITEDNHDPAPTVKNADCLAFANRMTEHSLTLSFGDESCSDKKYPVCKCNTCSCNKGEYKSRLL